MEAIEYSRRASVAEKGETLWRALPDRLEYYAPDGALKGVVPYDKVRRVRLAFAPGRLQQKRFLMELSGGRSRLVVTNLHFKGIGQFEDRSDTFFPMARAVVEGVQRASPGASFRAGEQPALYYLQLVFVLATLALLAVIVIGLPLVPGNFVVSVVVKLAVIAFSLPLLLSWIVHARPRRFDPATDLDEVFASR